jgi:acetyl esterase/lipase
VGELSHAARPQHLNGRIEEVAFTTRSSTGSNYIGSDRHYICSSVGLVSAVPFGAVIFAWMTLMAVTPLRRPRRLAVISWISSASPNEVPFLFLYLVIASTAPGVVAGDLDSTSDWISLALAVLTSAGLLVVAGRALKSGPVVERALIEGLGPQWRSELDPALAAALRRHLPWARILFVPWMFGRRDVERVANVAYGDDGTDNLLDVYRHRSRPTDAPSLIYLHGGGFRWGRKNREARPLLYHLASQGWTCISANYHLAPSGEAFPRNLVDVKKLVAWVRTDGRRYGVDPDTVFLVGASAGAHLAATAALTVNEPAFQPGFEAADTSITAGVGLYGYYGPATDDRHRPSTPLAFRGEAAPFFVIHGANDTNTPPDGARALVDHLRAVSSNPILYAELPGAQHSFDLFHSVRFETVIDGIEAFAAWVRSQRRAPTTRDGACHHIDQVNPHARPATTS